MQMRKLKPQAPKGQWQLLILVWSQVMNAGRFCSSSFCKVERSDFPSNRVSLEATQSSLWLPVIKATKALLEHLSFRKPGKPECWESINNFSTHFKVSSTSERTSSLLRMIRFRLSCCTCGEKVSLNSPISNLHVMVDFEQYAQWFYSEFVQLII